jgi:hypothetical protein
MRNFKKEIECLARLNTLRSSSDEILDFLLLEEMVSVAQINSIKNSAEPHKDMHSLLCSLVLNKKLQLLEYEWTVLPLETIKILIVTEKSVREFTFN